MATNPTGGTVYNARNAQNKAIDQSNIRGVALSKPASVQTYIDPNTGKDSRQFDSSGQPVAGTGSFTTQPITGPINFKPNPQSTGTLNEANSVYANNGAGLGTSFTPTTQGVIDPKTGQVFQAASSTGTTQVASNSGLKQAAIEHMRGLGLTDQQIRTNLNDPAFAARISSTASNTGLGGTFDKNGMYVPSAHEQLADLGTQRDKAIADVQSAGGDPTSTAQEYAKKEADLRVQAAKEDADNKTANDTRTAGTVNGDSTITAPPITPPTPSGSTDPTTGLINTDGLSPEQKTLADAYNAMIKGDTQTQTDAKTNEQAALDANKTSSDKQDALLTGEITRQNTDAATIKANNDAQLAQDNQNLQDQKDAEQIQLQQTENQAIMANSKAETAAVNAAIAHAALSGGGGSSGGLAAIAATSAEYDQKLQDIYDKFGTDSITLSAKYAALFQTAHQNYTTNANKAITDALTAATAITTQQLSTEKARGDANAAVIKTFNDAVTAARTKLATDLKDGVNAMNTLNQQATDNKFKQQVHDDSVQAHKDSLAAAAQTHSDAMLARGDAVAAKAVSDAYTKGRTLATKMQSDIASTTASPNLSTYKDFNVLYQKYITASNHGNTDMTNETTSVLMQDLLANANNPKLTARMPSQTLEILDKNRSYWQNILGVGAKFKGQGLVPPEVLKDMNTVMDGMHQSAVENAQDEVKGYIVSAIYQNTLMPAGYQHYGINITDLTQAVPSELVDGAFKELNDAGANIQGESLGNVDSGGDTTPPDDTSYYNTSSKGSTSLGPTSTVSDLFHVYAPSADGNSPDTYAADVAAKIGVTPDTPISTLVSKVPQMAQAIADHEGYTSGASRLARVNNNPGNLKFIGQAGAVQGEKGFAKFATPEAGFTALQNDLLAKIHRGSQIATTSV